MVYFSLIFVYGCIDIKSMIKRFLYLEIVLQFVLNNFGTLEDIKILETDNLDIAFFKLILNLQSSNRQKRISNFGKMNRRFPMTGIHFKPLSLTNRRVKKKLCLSRISLYKVPKSKEDLSFLSSNPTVTVQPL